MKTQLIRRYIGIAVSIVAILAIFFYFSDIITWLILAWILSLLGSPIMSFLGRIQIGKWKMSNSIKALITLLVFFVIIGLFVAMFVPLIVQQGRNLAGVNYAAVMDGLEEPINHFYERLADWGVVESIPNNNDSTLNNTPTDTLSIINANDSTATVDILLEDQAIVKTQTIQIDSLIKASGDTITHTSIQLQINIDPSALYQNGQLPNQIIDSTAIVSPTDSPIERLQKQAFAYINPSAFITSLFSRVLGVLGNLLTLIVSVSFITFFFLQEDRLFSNAIKTPFPDKYSAQLDRTLFLIKKMLIRYFEGILGQVTIICLYLWLLLWLIGSPNAFFIAFFAAIINVVPYLGPVLGMAFGVIVCICSNLDMDFYSHTYPLLIKVVLVFVSMQTLDNLLLQPLIFSKSVKAHPLEIFLAIIVGAKLGGIPGMVAAIPLYTVIRVIASVFLSEFKIVRGLTQQLGIKPNWMQAGGEDAPPPPEDDKQQFSDDKIDDGWH